MRPFAIILCVALSGLPSRAAEALEGAGAADACSACPGEASGAPSEAPADSGEHRSCSPICPDCVCSLAARTALPAVLLLSAPALTSIGDVRAATLDSVDPPREFSRDGVFHPPKR